MGDEGVKSARRVFEFLEHFAAVRREVSVAELAARFGYPNSSVSSIMRTMVGLGYLSYNGSSRTYLPTARLPLLTDWVGAQLYDRERVQAIMRELSALTGETILLGMQNGTRLQYLEVIDATGPVRLHAEAGGFRGMGQTAVGLALLSRFPDSHVEKLLARANAAGPESEIVDTEKVVANVRAIRRQGYAVSIGGVVPGAGAVAVMLPSEIATTPLAIGISSVERVIVPNTERFVQLLHQSIGQRLDDLQGSRHES